ncbi:MAG: hypothetical protein CUN55_07120 [Phototrophicales bacterium]|nr:MAG: hypothetical protein CUN55_07120 [Phototrophicales bacterium]
MKRVLPLFQKHWRIFVAISAMLFLNVAIFVAIGISDQATTAYAQDGPNADEKLEPIDFYPSPNQNGAMAFSILDPWDKTDLTFYFHNCPSKLDCTAAHGAIRQAFQAWANVSSLTFTEVTDVNAADIEVTFTTDDPQGVLGEPGGVLAYNFFPRYGGDMFIDDTEPWTIADKGEFDLVLAAIHEIGHGIGIDHSEYKDAIMYPYAGFAKEIGPDDIQAVQQLYGPPTTSSDTPSDTPTTSASPEELGEISVVVNQTQEIKGTVDSQNPLNIWTLNVPANSIVTVTMYRTSGDLDPYVGILTEDFSSVLAENDNWLDNDARVVYTFDTGGTYKLVATRFGFYDGTSSGTYTLTIEASGEAPPDGEVAPPAPQTIAWRITNQAGTELCAIFFSPSTSTTWGTDQIASEGPLQDGFYYEWQLTADTYDVQVWDCFNNKLEYYNITATRDVNIVVYQNRIEVLPLETEVTATVDDTSDSATFIWRVSNYANVELCAIYFSPTTSDQWGENQIAGDTLQSLYYYQWELPADTYDIRVEDCASGYLEFYEITLDKDLEIAIYNNVIEPRSLR